MITYEVKVYSDGNRYWTLNGKFHRMDGPAIEWANGGKFWYIHGKQLTEQEFLKATNPAKELTVAEIEDLLGYPVKIVEENDGE